MWVERHGMRVKTLDTWTKFALEKELFVTALLGFFILYDFLQRHWSCTQLLLELAPRVRLSSQSCPESIAIQLSEPPACAMPERKGGGGRCIICRNSRAGSVPGDHAEFSASSDALLFGVPPSLGVFVPDPGSISPHAVDHSQSVEASPGREVWCNLCGSKKPLSIVHE
jgi:hypothetical protein